MLRTNHYDLAFEAFLRERRLPYISVDEQRRALLEQASLKSFDFIVYSPHGPNWLVDVKGRRFPSADGSHRWENWATGEDIPSLLHWEQVFGSNFRSLLVFAYDLLDPAACGDFDETFDFRDRTYAFFGVWAADYAAEMKTRSPKWDTVDLPMARFRELRHPLSNLLQGSATEPTCRLE